MSSRAISVDVLRGLTIFMMIVVNTPGSWSYVYGPLQHAAWHGATPTDLVFPSFLFVVGLSMSLSFRKYDSNPASTMVTKLLRRALIIFIAGLFLNWFPFYHKHLSDLRIFGILQRIALAFLGAGIIVVSFKNARIITVFIVLLLLLHWLLLYVFGGSDPYSLESNFSRTVDLTLFGENHLYKGFGIPFDPEGLLGTLSSIAQILISYLLGIKFMPKKPYPIDLIKLTGLAILFIVAGILWDLIYPINKPLWTGSYVLYTSGIIIAFWSVLIWILDLKGWTSWSFVFEVFGRNPLISFMLSILWVKIFIYLIKFEDTNLYSWLFHQLFQPWFGNYSGSLLFAISFTFFIWLFAWFLYRKQIIIKV